MILEWPGDFLNSQLVDTVDYIQQTNQREQTKTIKEERNKT